MKLAIATGGVDRPPTNPAAASRFPESSCDNGGRHKILLAYASEFGTTSEVAVFIGKVLCQAGATVDIKWIKNVKDLNKYDAVIVGSAIQYDKWMPDAVNFVTTHRDSLSKLPVAYFFTCLTLSKRTEQSEQQAMVYAKKLSALSPQVKPVSVGRFAGVLDYGRLPFFFRLISKVIYLFLGVREGDYRDWDAIRTWTEEVSRSFDLKDKSAVNSSEPY